MCERNILKNFVEKSVEIVHNRMYIYGVSNNFD